MRELKGQLVAKGKRFAIVLSRFNEFVSEKMLSGAVDTLIRHGVKDGEITTVWVPGAFEIPFTAQRLAQSKRYHAVICLGAVIRGETPHFDYIAAEVSKGISQVSLKVDVPVIFGVLTVDTLEQAIERAGTKAGNKGRDAAHNAIEMVNLADQLSSK